MTPPTAPFCSDREECHDHGDGGWTHEHIMDALAEIKIDVGAINKSINGNGQPGIKSRLFRIEAAGAISLIIITLLVTIGSCAVSNGYLVVPTVAKAAQR